ncbi:MAG: hypothetical protein WC284_11535 [Candidimonas sp.]
MKLFDILESIIPDYNDEIIISPYYMKYLYKNMGSYPGKPFGKNEHINTNTTEWLEHFLFDKEDEIKIKCPHVNDVGDLTNKCVRDFVKKWLKQRLDYVRGKLESNLKIINGKISIYRSIRVNKKVVDGIVKERIRLGNYWTFDANKAESKWSFSYDKPITINGLVEPRNVDWITTIRRNMDYMYGDYEDEIYLKTGTPVYVIDIETPDMTIPVNRTLKV